MISTLILIMTVKQLESTEVLDWELLSLPVAF